MKQTRKLTLLVMTALALSANGHDLAAAPAPRQAAVSAESRQELLTVASVEFKGLRSLSAEELSSSLPLKAGARIAVPGPELAGAMQYLWNLEFFNDITLDRRDLGAGRIALTFIVTERPKLESVAFNGNDKFKDRELERLIELPVGRRVTEQELVTAATKIEKRYAEKGYLTASADYRLEEGTENRYKALYSIKEGPKVHIETITFHGNEAFKQGKLRGVFKETSQNSWWRSIFGTPKLDRDKYADDKELLVEFYRNNGYRDAKVLRDSISYSDDKKKLFLDIWLDEGPKYSIGTITWIGNTKDFATTEILNETFRIKSGDLYSAEEINKRLNFSEDNSDVSSLYLDRGYLSFRATLEEEIPSPGVVDLRVYLREGEQFQLDKISIRGNTKTKDHVIRRELYTVPGDMFSRRNVVRSIRELNMLNYFDPETLTPDIEPDASDNTVDLTYNVTEKQTDTFNASVGYSGSGFTGAFGVTFNNFSLRDLFKGEAWDPIPHGDGQKLGFQWQFGSDSYRTISLNFTEPWAYGTPTSVGFSAFTTHRSYDYTDDDVDNAKSIDQYGATLSVGRRLTWPDDYFSINWKLKYLHSEGGFVTFIEESDDAPDQADEVSITQTITRNSIDNPIYPRTGSRNSLSAQLAGGPLPGNVEFYKFTGSSNWFIPVTPVSRDLVWNLSTQHGYMDTFSQNDYIPYTEYFYMGGSGMSSLPTVSLRGYDDRSIGTQLGDESDEDSELWGGTIYSKFTTELRYPLTLTSSVSIYALTFLEAGAVWKDSESVDFSELKKSAGVGVRLYLPIIGQVGIDYGYGFDDVPSDDDTDKEGWGFMFSFGSGIQ